MTNAFNIDCMEYMKTLPDNAFDLAIVDPPYYVGSTIDKDFPDGLKCGMCLPCPGTDSPDMLEGSV